MYIRVAQRTALRMKTVRVGYAFMVKVDDVVDDIETIVIFQQRKKGMNK